ncbi:NAD(P)-binding domain-containing protein [Candidatus Lokiarchaeum ossiferum]|uniref:NAD(P)-binding domain-containing protein n=1 Tax=Candidatus Lokiarchaeum ossiferum TaxID=2951803 RepID=UPI00352CCB9F
MKEDKNLKVTIIGFGNLAESLFYYLEQFIGPENYLSQINATTADVETIEKKRNKYGISIILENNVEALKLLQPDIIFFSPPPSVAPRIIQNELTKYFDFIRQHNLPLPDIYAFPPVPDAELYQTLLGKNVQVVTILPNDVREIGSKRLIGEGVTFCVFPSKWKQESYSRLRRFLSPFGEIYTFKTPEILPILSTRVLTTAFAQIVVKTTEIVKKKLEGTQIKVSHNNIAKTFQNLFLNFKDSKVELDTFESSFKLDNITKKSLESIIIAWYSGILEYTRKQNFPHEKADFIVSSMLDLILQLSVNVPKEKLNDLLFISATKGGLLETCLNYIQINIFEHLQDILTVDTILEKEQVKSKIYNEVINACNIVLEHGKNLTK